MKQGIHPKWYPEARFRCMACGTEWTVGATQPEVAVDICAACHPFYTGEQKIVDTEGRVDMFMKRLRAQEEFVAQQVAKDAARANADIPLSELGISERYVKILNEHGINLVSDLIEKLENEGDDAITALPGIGVKVLTDAKRRISERGYQLQRA
ncbi:MAG: 50S ribosomal protein L31 [Anaerolineae bacterium]|nr:50S ribosomal protein L31 [Anaerolineae bacterium]